MDRLSVSTQNFFSKNSAYAIFFLMIATIIQSAFGFARDATPLAKACIALFCWCSLFFSIKNISFIRVYPNFVKVIIISLMASVLFSLLNSVFTGRVLVGEKYTVIFTNMSATLDLIGVFFITAITDLWSAKMLLKSVYWLIPISLFFLIFNYEQVSSSYVLTYIMMYSSIFFPYLKKKYKLYLLGGYALSIVAFLEGGRQAALIMFFCVLSILISMYGKKKLTFVISLIVFLCPFVLTYYSVNYESIFSIIENGKEYQDGLNTDTRTFLWIELFSDMHSQSVFTQLFGKGVLGYYVSDWFGVNRLGLEVPILQWFLQAGAFYVVCLTLLVFFSILFLYKFGQNRMCLAASVMIAGVYFNMFISNILGCNISTLGIWFLISIAFNENFLLKDDSELKKKLNESYR